MTDDRPATTDQQPAVYGATQPARLVITETVAASRTQGDGPWTTAEAILGALDRAGYTVAPKPVLLPPRPMTDEEADEFIRYLAENPAPRASQAATAPHSPGGDAGAAPDHDRRSTATTGTPMRPEDVPDEIVLRLAAALCNNDNHGVPWDKVRRSTADRYRRLASRGLAAVIPAIRAQVADEIEATIGGYPENEAVRPKVERGGYLNDADWAAAIARGDQ